MWASVLASRQLTTLQLRLEPSGVLFLTLHRPAAFNAISMEMLNELHAVFDALQHPSSMLEALPPDFPRVVVLAGAGRAFSGGVDIKAADQGIGGQAWDYKDMRSQQLLSRLIEKMRAAPQPIIAAVQGAAAGGGLALALASDVRIAARGASFSAAFLGLVNELVEEAGQLEAAARKLAAEMLACSRLGLQSGGDGGEKGGGGGAGQGRGVTRSKL
ncbi:hypothetical protein CHLNCDRAFT_134510 [Chlorella variabilis]|uniref:3-hydroxyisobutyryl-coenzyme A hydrolase n=1 Tax=Chlorella variabilis TaxID=554065 RepID=E1ZG46_CHLVA|nr:hypothetical protein CHLNCDRAFT_134510 [Chlorella variabilis]EFN55400.1 hypothetical protein CHLNCDRAFT_134510 [Chlorella variabilis]|eukprot:XP_005847502.1 hypothetical protein CHLNCDRAFT_134510 [Chlorella variabilis]